MNIYNLFLSIFVWMASIQIVTALEEQERLELSKKLVRVESLSKPEGPTRGIEKGSKYRADVTLYIKGENGERIPSGWSTRVEDGAEREQPFEFQPGVSLIEGWTMGVMKMVVGERALMHVPAALGYGDQTVGSKGGAFYIPANSNLVFDIKILERVDWEEGEEDEDDDDDDGYSTGEL